ncbi:MerR family transcriptional regulator [bacterium]|nr:MerR family transcriptional regulator [candidate division CSSED10-310 bacterium]
MRTGLTAHAIRAWEKRYEVVSPERTDTNRRLYSEADVTRLQLLKNAIDAGYCIGQIAAMSDARLVELLDESGRPTADELLISCRAESGSILDRVIAGLLEVVRQTDPEQVRDALSSAVTALGHPVVREQLLAPLFSRLGVAGAGDGTHVSRSGIALAGEIVRGMLPAAAQPLLLLAGLAGQESDLGLSVIAGSSIRAGWRVFAAGEGLEPALIVRTAVLTGADAVVIPFVAAPDQEQVEALLDLVGSLPSGALVVFLGKQLEPVRPALEARGARVAPDMKSLEEELESQARSCR